MLKTLLFFISLISFSKSFAAPFSLGFMLGAPTDISGKVGVSANRSIDGFISLYHKSSSGSDFDMHIDYLIENARNLSHEINLYYGIGARLIEYNQSHHEGHTGIGPRTPIGVNYNIQNPNLEFLAELAPVIDIIPHTDLDFEVGIGIRYRF